jgi:hypothetical protein
VYACGILCSLWACILFIPGLFVFVPTEMSRVITFSRVFPSHHPRAGEPTYFVEKVWNSIAYDLTIYAEQFPIPYKELGIDFSKVKDTDQKHHTIRAGHRWKVGDYFSPRVWSGKPYNSKQIQFAPDIEIKNVWDFQIRRCTDGILVSYEMFIDGNMSRGLYTLFENDGLTYNDFCDWFKMGTAKKEIHFDGQIICWNKNINY